MSSDPPERLTDPSDTVDCLRGVAYGLEVLRQLREDLDLLQFRREGGKCERCRDTKRLHHRGIGGFGISWPCECTERHLEKTAS